MNMQQAHAGPEVDTRNYSIGSHQNVFPSRARAQSFFSVSLIHSTVPRMQQELNACIDCVNEKHWPRQIIRYAIYDTVKFNCLQGNHLSMEQANFQSEADFKPLLRPSAQLEEHK